MSKLGRGRLSAEEVELLAAYDDADGKLMEDRCSQGFIDLETLRKWYALRNKFSKLPQAIYNKERRRINYLKKH